MADPPLSQLGVALQATLDQELLKALTLATGTATSLPDPLQGANHTLVLTGTILPQAGAADPTQVVVQTSAGQVSLSLDDTASLPKGTITLVVQPAVAGNPPAISIVAQQRAPAPVQPAPVQSAATAQIQIAQPQAQAAIPTLAAGQTVTATLLPDAVRQAPPVPAQPSPAPASASSGQSQAAQLQPTATLLQNAVRPVDTAPPGPAYATLLQQSAASPVQAAAAEETEDPPAAVTAPSLPATTTPAAAAPAVSTQPEGPGAQEPAAPPAAQAQPQAAGPQATPVASGSQTLGPLVQASLAGSQATEPAVSQLPSIPVQALAQPEEPAEAPTAEAPVSANPLLEAQAEPAPQGQVYAAQPQTANFLILQVASPTDATKPIPTTPENGVASAGTPFTATVVGQSVSQQPLLSSPQGGMLLSRPANVEIGAQVTLQRLPQAQPGPQAGAAQPLLPLNLLAQQAGNRPAWPALTQLMATLQHDQPTIAAHLAVGLPNVGASGFARAFASFLSPAAQGGQPDPGLPPGLADRQVPDAQARMVQALVQQLQDDLGAVGRAVTAPLKADEWRAHLVPVLNGTEAEAVQLFVRQQQDANASDGDGERKFSGTTRFLVEIAPQHTGPVQLDGLLRQVPLQPLRLDLVIRTTTELGEDANAAMTGLFQAALVNSGLQGSVRFQPGQEHFVQPASGAIHQLDRQS